MAGPDPRLSAVRARARALDDDALAALANRGLVRRALKDVAAVAPVVVESSDEGVVVAVDGARVTLVEVPTQMRCDCPADGVCRHVVAALIHLRDLGGSDDDLTSATDEHSARDEILALDDDALRRWAGATLLKRARRAAAEEAPIELVEGNVLELRLQGLNASVAWIAGAGPEATLCSCHAPQVCLHRVAAVLVLQRDAGRRTLRRSEAVLDAATGTPRSRDEVLTAVGGLLHEVVGLGLARLSRASERRARTLAVSAHGVDLPRLARRLRAFADAVAAVLAREAAGDTATVFAVACEIEALRIALRDPNPDLVGQHRTRYVAIGVLELDGLGGRRWRSATGYVGLTLYFRERGSGHIATWTEARPEDQAFDPHVRWGAPGPWSGCARPALAAAASLRLAGAFRNPEGRLSGRPGSTALVTGHSDPTALRATSDWGELMERARRVFGGGLQKVDERDVVVALRPSAWEPAVYDEIAQAVRRPVRDAADGIVELVLRFRNAEDEPALRALEAYDPRTCRGVLGLLRLGATGLEIEPIALHDDDGIHSLGFGDDDATSAPNDRATTTPDDGVIPDPVPESLPAGSALGRLLVTVGEAVAALAEGGPATLEDPEPLAELERRCARRGLSITAEALARVIRACALLRRGHAAPDAAPALLRAGWIVELALRQDAVVLATGA